MYYLAKQLMVQAIGNIAISESEICNIVQHTNKYKKSLSKNNITSLNTEIIKQQ